MKNLLLLVMMLVIASFSGCTEFVNPGGVDEVEILYVETLDEGCRIRYRIEFNDAYEGGNGTSYYYWPALADPSIRAIVALDEGAFFTPPFNDMSLYLDVTTEWKIAHGSKLYARVYRSSSEDGLGDTEAPCGTDTDDFLSPGFDDACYPFHIAVTANGANVEETECVYIDDWPALPALGAAITSGGVTGLVDWRLTISYLRSERTDIATFTATLNAATTWDISSQLGDTLRGGQAVVMCTPQDTSKGSRTYAFAIRGTNASEATITNYIASLSGVMRYHKYVTKHESGVQVGRHYLQFNEEPVSDYHCGDANDIKHTPNASGDGGFGLYQLTRFEDSFRVPNTQELWDWKENVNSGTAWLRQLQGYSNTYLETERLQAYYWCPFVPECYAVPDDTAGGSDNVVFSDGTNRVIEHAVALKKYNGLGIPPVHNYCWFDDTENIWLFDRWARYYNSYDELDSNQYVHSVCSEVP